MLALKMLLTIAGVLLLAAALGMPLFGVWKYFAQMRRKAKQEGIEGETVPVEPEPIETDWHRPVTLAIAACVPMLIAASIVVVPSGMGGIRISQISGTMPGTMYPGIHFITPLFDSVQIFDLRDRIYTSGNADQGSQPVSEKKTVSEKSMSRDDKNDKGELIVQSQEGLNIGLGVTVRYRLDPNKLSSVQAHLPQPADKQIVPPVVESTWRELAPHYTVREIFSSKREEVRAKAAAEIQRKLGADGIIVEEVMLSEIQLPEEYAKGLEGLLLKEQQDDQMGVDTEIQQKQVRIAELQAEAEAAQKVKAAEGDAKARVVEAKGESDAMQYTLPLKQKQIEQSKLEAEARKEATIQNADASAQAKVIDSKAEMERRDLLANAEANRIRVVSVADAERMKSEAQLLNQSPLLINKIVAERLSDKIQVVMVPSDGKFFFANDVFKGAASNSIVKQEMDSESAPAAGQKNGQ